MKLTTYLNLVNFLTHPFGVAPFENGTGHRSYLLYTITIVLFVFLSYSNYWHWKDAYELSYYRARIFHLTFTFLSSMSTMCVVVRTLTKSRTPISLKSVRRAEQILGIRIQYDVKYLSFCMYFSIPVCIVKIIIDNLALKKYLQWSDIIILDGSVYIPSIIRYVMMVRYGAIIRIFRRQLEILGETALDDRHAMIAHDYIVELCNVYQYSERYELSFNVFGDSLNVILNLLFLHEIIESCRSQNSTCIIGIVPGLIIDLIVTVTSLYCVTFGTYTARMEADRIVRRHRMKSVVRYYTRPDVRCLVYYLRAPCISLSVGGFFQSSPSTYMHILSENFIYYLLMIQMKAIVKLEETQN